jgi:hypothetical protein
MADISFGKIQSGVADLANNIVDGIMATLGMAQERTEKWDTNFSKFTNSPDFQNETWKKSLGFAFQVYRVETNGNIKGDPNWEEFRLQINPQELTQDEIFAIEVTPTFRGVVVEHHGTVLKDIVIAGTTGVSPLRREGGAVRATGKPVMSSGHSGFEEFHTLRSYVRAYVEAKRRDTKENGELRLVFKNFKDNEQLFVEPQKFTMKRTAGKPFMYDYNFAMKAIGIALPKSDDGDNGDLLGTIFDVINTASNLIEFGTQVINGSVGLVRRTERDVSNTIIQPLNRVSAALAALAGGREAIFGEFGITRRFMENLNNALARVENNYNDLVGTDMTAYNAAAGRTSTEQAAAGRQPTGQDINVLNGFNKAKRGLTLLLAEDSLFTPDSDAAADNIRAAYGDKIDFKDPNSVRDANIETDDTIQSLAARELGDPDRFREIVALNNLKPPYIDEAGGSGVLKPGAKILLPAQSLTTGTGVKRNKEFEITRFLTEAEKALGVDIRLDKNNDLAQSNTKDLDLIAGMENMSQAVLLKLFYEKGSLKRHLIIGTDLGIGEKTTTKNLNRLRDSIIGSYGTDLRIDNLPYISLRQEGNTTFVDLVIKLKDIDQPVPIPLKILNAS